MSVVRTRFAPSPTGHLHVGGARTAIFNWLYAQRHGGTMILRVEDTDQERSTLESEALVLDDLRWLGLTWSEGPVEGGPHAPYRQSERLTRYGSAADELLRTGVGYRCFCTEEILEAKREAARAEGKPPHYDLTCYGLDATQSEARAASEPFVVRFHVGRPGEDAEVGDVEIDDLVRGNVAWKHDSLGDFIVLRKDGMPTYNFAVVVDDHDMEISHVIRGEEHLTNTHRQVLIYRALGWDQPSFAHVSLILGEDRSKLSKRHGAVSIGAFAERGILPEALGNYLTMLGWSHPEAIEKFTLEEAAEVFDLDRVSSSPAVFDETKLGWLNGEYVTEIPTGGLLDGVVAEMRTAGLVDGDSEEMRVWLTDAVELVRAGADRIGAISEALRFFFEWDVALVLTDPEVAEVLGTDGARRVVFALGDDLETSGAPASEEAFREMTNRVRELSGEKGRGLFMPLRVALTGQVHGPELKTAIPLIARSAPIAELEGVVDLKTRVNELIETGALQRPEPSDG